LTIDFIHHDHSWQSESEGLRQHVASLWKRSFSCIDKENDAVDHRECTLNLAAEIRVARGIDEVDLNVIPRHRSGLRKDRDASLTFLIVGVHDSVDNSSVVAEGTCGSKQSVDKGGLTVINVSDERDVSKRD
jgi:hypothetical protein